MEELKARLETDMGIVQLYRANNFINIIATPAVRFKLALQIQIN